MHEAYQGPVSSLNRFISGFSYCPSTPTASHGSDFPSWSQAGWDCHSGGTFFPIPHLSSTLTLRVALSESLLDRGLFWDKHVGITDSHGGPTCKYYSHLPPSELQIRGCIAKFESICRADRCNHCNGFEELRIQGFAPGGETNREPGHKPAYVRVQLHQVPNGLGSFLVITWHEIHSQKLL